MDELFYEIFEDMPRLGPGSDSATLKALSKLPFNVKEIKALDIGCGTGAQTFVLANHLYGKIIALDNYQPFLDQIKQKASTKILKAEIQCHCRDMKTMTCKNASLDLIWGEGSIYIIGFKKGLKKIYPMLKPNAFVVFSDMNYLKPNPPSEVKEFFEKESPEMISIEQNIDLIKKSSYTLLHHFKLNRADHWNPYYKPLENQVNIYSANYKDNQNAMNIISEFQQEIDLYKKFSDYYGYVYYIMQKK